MKDIYYEYSNWYNHVLTEWLTFIGQITVCYLIHSFILYLFRQKDLKLPRAISVILGWIIAIVVFAPAMNL